MSIPSQPTRFFPRPFAENGNYQSVIPDTEAGSGRASYAGGFPSETQLPLPLGGVAPNRLDFNGLFNILTAFGFWQQSGGQWTYSASLNYTVPCIVFHDGKLWWCLQENGPDSANGKVEPGTNDTYWEELLQSLAAMGGGSSIGNPVGSILIYYGIQAPEGYFACDGATFSATLYPQLRAVLGSTILPDMRGYFIRGYDTRNSVDPDGSAREFATVQPDAGRNVTGAFTALLQSTSDIFASGAFWIRSIANISEDGKRKGHQETPTYGLDASRSWGATHTAAEFRPKNINLLYCIKHD